MSMGYGGKAVVEYETEHVIIYKYCCFNWNLKIYAVDEDIYSGEICNQKSALEEYKREISLSQLREERKILIKDACEAWDTVDGIDIVGARLIWKVLDMYKENGTLPQRVGVFW